jgi:hypothetical protein
MIRGAPHFAIAQQSMPAESGIHAGTPSLVVQVAVTLVK